jgi:hypothetical protein
MLHRALGVQQAGVDRADLGPFSVLDQRIDPVWFDHFHVVIQEKKEVTL